MTKSIITTSINVVYENRFATVYDNDVLFPSGVAGRYLRTRWKAPYGVVVVPVQGDRVILLEHYRYAELSLSIELPQGFGSDGSTPMEDAARELFEETGLRPLSIRPLITTGKDFVNHIFIAEIEAGAVPEAGNAEDTEAISAFHTIRLDDIALSTIAGMGIMDPITIIGLLSVARS